jgi:para-nitrobenzyl esterase
MQPSTRLVMTLILTATIAGRGGAQAGAATAPVAPAGAPRATTTRGVVRGIALPSGVRAFRGIPFAAPPVRDLRWKPPQPVARWQGVRAADRFANQCMQARVFGDMMFRNAGVSEDCLYLNVWTPRDARLKAGLPVLVYFYGGGFVAGDGSEPRYDGESMATRGIVVVTMSYRLGIFGFFAHPALTAESPHRASGNYAYMDQAAALRWVRDNIAAFGGDPNQVTIAGESAGSASVSAQMASPLAKGLFARAIGESGALMGGNLGATTRASAEQNGVRFADMVGARSLSALRALSATELLESSSRPGAPRFGTIVDGWFFPKAPSETFAAGEQSRVPLLAGWNSEEMSGRALLQDEPTAEKVRAVYAQQFGARAAEAEKFFPLGTSDQIAQSLTDLAGDRFIAYNTWKWLEEHARTSGQPVYRYLYARPRPATVEAGVTANLAGGVTRGGTAAPAPVSRGAVHSAEIEYAMGNLHLNPVFAWTDEDRKVSQTMQGYFANFIRTGNPNGAGLPEWPTGGVDASGNARRIRIDVETRAEQEPRARYLFLDSAPPPVRP